MVESTPILQRDRAVNSAVECYLHTVEVTGSIPVPPTNSLRRCPLAKLRGGGLFRVARLIRDPAEGRRLFDHLAQLLRERHPLVATGRFGADMQVSLVNDGPVTFWLQVSPNRSSPASS